MFKSKRKEKLGFTLAEVIITISIIGVVSALTIPAVITNYQKRQTITGLQKSYNTFNQIIDNAIRDKGAISTWKFDSETQVFEDYFKPYINYAQRCERTSENVFCRYMYKSLDGSSGYFNYNNTYYLNDGTVFSLVIIHGTLYIFIDTNGAKKPNIIGKDIFVFAISKNSKNLLPYMSNRDRDLALSVGFTPDSAYHCNKERWGWACASIIIKDGWQIKDDYPW